MDRMFEGLRKTERGAKTESEAPASPERRLLLRRMAATAAFSAVPLALRKDLAEAADVRLVSVDDIKRRERLLDETISRLSAFARSQSVREALDGKGDRPVVQVLRALQTPINPDLLLGTKYDSGSERVRNSVQICYGYDAYTKRTANWTTSGRTNERPFFRPEQGRYANGIFFRSSAWFLTASHVRNMVDNKPYTIDGELDLTLIGRPGPLQGRVDQIVTDDLYLSNEHIHGSFVTVEGIDPDATAGAGGYKTYASIALRLNPAIAAKMLPTQKEAAKLVGRSFMIALPPGEAHEGPQGRPGSGMSGSAVYMAKNDKRNLVGILHAVGTIQDPETGRTVDVGWFHGIDEVREVTRKLTAI